MKKILSFVSILIVSVLCLGGCFLPFSADDTISQSDVIESLGEYSDEEYYTNGGLRDYAAYAKYKYEEPQLENNPYLKPITEEALAEFMGYIENFEKWVVASGEGDPDNELFRCYDFNDSLITEDDYVFIENRKSTDDEVLGNFNYNLYLFDMGTNTLYYFHNNT